VARSIYYFTDSRIVGGAERALFMLIAGLDRASWRPTVLLERGEGVEALAEHAQDAGAQVEVVAPMPLGTVGARRTPAFARLLHARRPDVFHAHLSWPLAAKYGLASAVLARVPAVVATLQLVPEMTMDRSNRIQLRLLDRGVGRYIAVSQDVKARLVELGWPARKIDVIYNAVEPERYGAPAPAGVREELAGSPERCLVLTVARLHDQKGHRFLLKAAVDVPGAVFAIAGDGPERPALERQARELGVEDRVLFLGHRQDVPLLLAACDVFALPSLYEGSPLAVLEAMAARRPVIASAIGGPSELIDDGVEGLLVPPGDAAGLAAALRRLCGDAELRSSLAEQGRKRVEQEFTAAAMTARVTEVYEDLLSP
jgi:glycosyltransferase involved in cell wall biosynthesis